MFMIVHSVIHCCRCRVLVPLVAPSASSSFRTLPSVASVALTPIVASAALSWSCLWLESLELVGRRGCQSPNSSSAGRRVRLHYGADVGVYLLWGHNVSIRSTRLWGTLRHDSACRLDRKELVRWLQEFLHLASRALISSAIPRIASVGMVPSSRLSTLVLEV